MSTVRVGLIAFAAYHFAIAALMVSAPHTFFADIGSAHPRWLGLADFISLALATVALVWLARESMRPTEVQR
jgi:deoxyinosine 3'endonuclease (endonuclease V)